MAEQNNENRNEDLGELLKIRRQKLADLQAAGKDPFQIRLFVKTNQNFSGFTRTEGPIVLER